MTLPAGDYVPNSLAIDGDTHTGYCVLGTTITSVTLTHSHQVSAFLPPPT